MQTIILTEEETDRLVEKLDMFRNDPDADHLKRRIVFQQRYNPADVSAEE